MNLSTFESEDQSRPVNAEEEPKMNQRFAWGNLVGKLLFTTALIMFLTSCAPRLEPSKQILGKWQSEDGLAVQFFEDGAMKVSYPANSKLGGKHDSGTWTLLPDNKIEVLGEGSSERPVICTVTFLADDRLMVKGPDGASVRMTREKNG
jgi:hypothetical protein